MEGIVTAIKGVYVLYAPYNRQIVSWIFVYEVFNNGQILFGGVNDIRIKVNNEIVNIDQGYEKTLRTTT